MFDHDDKRSRAPSRYGPDAPAASVPGKRTRVAQLQAAGSNPPVQRSGASTGPAVKPDVAPAAIHELFGRPVQRRVIGHEGGEQDPAVIHRIARQGMASAASPMPHAGRIQRAFGRHDVSQIQAHTGAEAAAAAADMGATAYAAGEHVVLGEPADLHTVAHEAAHVVQQRRGVRLAGGVGEAGDAYERHADAVADAVVHDRSAERLLDEMAGGGAPGERGEVQRVLQSTGGDSYVDSRDAGPDRFVFKHLGGDQYKAARSGVVYTYFPQTDQFGAPDGTYFDPYSRRHFTWHSIYHCYSSGMQWYWYDGAHYHPYPPQQPAQPQQLMQAQQPAQPQQPMQPQQPAQPLPVVPSSSSGRSNADFRRLLYGGAKQSLGSQIPRDASLRETLDAVRAYAESDLEEALERLATGGHATGVKGLTQRLDDVGSFSKQDPGHEYAQWATYQLFVELLQKYRGSRRARFLELQKNCKQAGFDQKPRRPDDDDDDHLGDPVRTRPKQRLNLFF